MSTKKFYVTRLQSDAAKLIMKCAQAKDETVSRAVQAIAGARYEWELEAESPEVVPEESAAATSGSKAKREQAH